MNKFSVHPFRGIAFLAVSICLFAISLQATVPSNYDLRDYGWITPTKDQGPLGTCWAFASTTAFQSSLLRHGVVSGPQSESLDVSIWHLATHNGVGEPDLTYPYDSWGGDNFYTEGYLTRGRGEWAHQGHSLTIGGGYVLNSEDPLNVYPIDAVYDQENLAPYVPPVDQPLAGYRLQSSFNYKYQAAGAPDASYRQALQQAILDRGGVSATMFAGGDTPETDFNAFYNAEHHTFQVTGPASSETANHLIVLAGWDDDKAVYDKDGVHISTGAWLVQNSWGDDWGDDGYFWMAYDDPIATKEADSFVAGDHSVPGQPGWVYTETVLQNQIFSPDNFIGPGIGTASMAVSQLSFSESSALGGIGLWSNEEVLAFSLGIYSSWNAGPEDLLFTDDYLVYGIGYKEVLIDLLAFLAEDVIYVLFDFGDDYAKPIAVDGYSLGLEGVDSFLGLSWVLGEGDEWLDLATLEGVEGIFFTKGLTVVPEPALWGLAPLVLALVVLRRRRQVAQG